MYCLINKVFSGENISKDYKITNTNILFCILCIALCMLKHIEFLLLETHILINNYILVLTKLLIVIKKPLIGLQNHKVFLFFIKI